MPRRYDTAACIPELAAQVSITGAVKFGWKPVAQEAAEQHQHGWFLLRPKSGEFICCRCWVCGTREDPVLAEAFSSMKEIRVALNRSSTWCTAFNQLICKSMRGMSTEESDDASNVPLVTSETTSELPSNSGNSSSPDAVEFGFPDSAWVVQCEKALVPQARYSVRRDGEHRAHSPDGKWNASKYHRRPSPRRAH